MTSAEIKSCSIRIPVFGSIDLKGFTSSCCSKKVSDLSDEQIADLRAAAELMRLNSEKASAYDREKALNIINAEIAVKWAEARALFSSESHIDDQWLHQEMNRIFNLDKSPERSLGRSKIEMPQIIKD